MAVVQQAREAESSTFALVVLHLLDLWCERPSRLSSQTVSGFQMKLACCCSANALSRLPTYRRAVCQFGLQGSWDRLADSDWQPVLQEVAWISPSNFGSPLLPLTVVHLPDSMPALE